LTCCRYVELNPVKAGMVGNAAEYPWSSYQERVSDKEQKLLDYDAQYLTLGTTATERKHRYNEFLASGIPSTEQRFIQESVSRNQLTGNHWFVDEIERRTGLRVERRGRGRPKNDEK